MGYIIKQNVGAVPCVVSVSCLWLFLSPLVRSCRIKDEYESKDGQCCPMCHEGTFVKKDCTALAGTVCESCKQGAYMDQLNSYKSCTTCSICDQGHGLFIHQPCTTVSNTVCAVLNGYFCQTFTDNGGCSLAFRHTKCEPGQKTKQAGTNRTDTVCEDCQSGYFSLDGVNCTAWTVCEETEIVDKEGNSSQDVACGSAGREHHVMFGPFLLLGLVLIGIIFKRQWNKGQ